MPAGVALGIPEANVLIGAPATVGKWSHAVPAGQCDHTPVPVSHAFGVRQIRNLASRKILGLAQVGKRIALVKNADLQADLRAIFQLAVPFVAPAFDLQGYLISVVDAVSVPVP